MPRPYKGDRLPLTARIPRNDSDRLEAVAELTSESKSDIVARIVHDYLESLDVDHLRALRGQEALIA